jgi:phenylpropionate dioxygenase-like ring-hydroxylating dioxygenase large terminal subunit
VSIDVSDLVLPDRVHRSLYTDPAIFAREMSRVFGHTWCYLAHESRLPEPNSYLTTRLGLRPIIVTRNADGELGAVFNRCAHRAVTVCRTESGVARTFQCPYHGWTFKNTGELVGVPWPEGYGPDFERSALSLGRVPRVASYRGFVFGTLNADAPDLTEHLGAAIPWLDYWIDRSPTGEVYLSSGAHRMVFRGNWKLAWDNAGDGYHPAFSHRSLLRMAGTPSSTSAPTTRRSATSSPTNARNPAGSSSRTRSAAGTRSRPSTTWTSPPGRRSTSTCSRTCSSSATRCSRWTRSPWTAPS